MTPSWVPENLRVKELQGELLAVRTSVICALNQLLDLKDLNTGVHSTRLAEWSVRIGRELGFDDGALRDLEVAAILHDIGKETPQEPILPRVRVAVLDQRQSLHDGVELARVAIDRAEDRTKHLARSFGRRAHEEMLQPL